MGLRPCHVHEKYFSQIWKILILVYSGTFFVPKLTSPFQLFLSCISDYSRQNADLMASGLYKFYCTLINSSKPMNNLLLITLICSLFSPLLDFFTPHFRLDWSLSRGSPNITLFLFHSFCWCFFAISLSFLISLSNSLKETTTHVYIM